MQEKLKTLDLINKVSKEFFNSKLAYEKQIIKSKSLNHKFNFYISI